MRNLLITAIAASALVSAAALVSTTALGGEKVTPVLKSDLQGLDGMEANIVLFEVDPGFQTERHIHPGHVFIYVMEGTIEIDLDGQDTIRASAGEAIYELPDKPMVGRNASSTEGARFVLFQIGPTGKPLMVPQPQ
jgi:quercetin dioxygenase-like cupin family protein